MQVPDISGLPVGTGRVFIAQRAEPDQGPDEFYGYWEADDDRGRPRPLEERGVVRSTPDPDIVSGPGFATVEAAIEWGRSRAPLVFVRTRATPGVYYSAGERDPEGEAPPRWPGT